MPSFRFTVIRGLFRIGELVSPRLSGRLAFELFCRTPNPQRLSTKERAVVEAAAPFMAAARRHDLATRFGRFAAYEFRPAHGHAHWPRALVIHGWRSRTEHMRPIIQRLLEKGFRVVAVDLPGHGHSPGRRLHMANAVASVQAASQWLGPFDTIVGHSFGGTVAVNAVAGSIAGVPAIPTDRLVLLAAPSAMGEIFDNFARFAGLGRRTRIHLDRQVERVAGKPLERYVGAEMLARIQVPTLVIHAPEDKEVPASNAGEYGAAGPHVRLQWVPGLGHRRIIVDSEVAAVVAAYATERLESTAAA